MWILGLAVALDAFVLALFVTGPNTGGPLVTSVPRLMWLVPAFGIALNLVGLVWMGRVAWSIRDPERHRAHWRSTR
jgi:hypothetical protein